jgi:hypothetical protein
MKATIAMNLSAPSLVLIGGLAWAAGQYGPGVSDTEIKIGNTMPYSGATSPYGTIGRSEAAYFRMVTKAASMGAKSTSSAETMHPVPLRHWRWSEG